MGLILIVFSHDSLDSGPLLLGIKSEVRNLSLSSKTLSAVRQAESWSRFQARHNFCNALSDILHAVSFITDMHAFSIMCVAYRCVKESLSWKCKTIIAFYISFFTGTAGTYLLELPYILLWRSCFFTWSRPNLIGVNSFSLAHFALCTLTDV